MIGRLLAVCGLLAWLVRRPFGGRLGALRRAAPVVVAGALLVAAAAPIVVPLLDPQPQDATVADVDAGAITEPSGWVRLRGRVVPLRQSPTDLPGRYGLLVDADDQLTAMVLRAGDRVEPAERTAVTGHVVDEVAIVEEELPIEATVFGAPPRILPHRIVELDSSPKPVRSTWWPLSLPPLLLAGMLLVGARSGYPIFRPTTEMNVLSTPLGPGERLPAAWGGHLGPHARDLGDPGGALLVVRPGPQGNVLTAQPLPDDEGPAPPPVTIGGGWTQGRVGDVHTASETVPALVVRAEEIDVTFLFARRAERDRVAALVAVERG